VLCSRRSRKETVKGGDNEKGEERGKTEKEEVPVWEEFAPMAQWGIDAPGT